MGVAIHATQVPLWCPEVSESSKWSYERTLITILFSDGHRVERVPNITHTLNLACRDLRCQHEGGLGVVGLPGRGLVEGLQVDRAPRLAIVLGHDHHPRTPGDWDIDRNRFDHPQCYIPHQITAHLFLPMQRYWHWCVDSIGFHI